MKESIMFVWISLKGAAKYMLEVFITGVIILGFAEFLGLIQPYMLQGNHIATGCILICLILVALGIGLFRFHIEFNQKQKEKDYEDQVMIGFEVYLADLVISVMSLLEIWSLYRN